MAAVERTIPGTFSKVPGGYSQEIDERTTLFIPDMCAASFIPETGELHGYAPDYDALEAAKSPAVHADKPGEYVYWYEMDHAPTGCDFSSELSYDKTNIRRVRRLYKSGIVGRFPRTTRGTLPRSIQPLQAGFFSVRANYEIGLARLLQFRHRLFPSLKSGH